MDVCSCSGQLCCSIATSSLRNSSRLMGGCSGSTHTGGRLALPSHAWQRLQRAAALVNCSRSARYQPLGGRHRPGRCLHTLAAASGDPATRVDAERSQLVNNEMVLLLLQLECDTQLQRALNYENFEAAQQIRERRQSVDEALQLLQESKGQGKRSKQAEMTDLATSGLRLRSELQKAVEEERYADAAELRDKLKVMEEQSASAQAQAAEWFSEGIAPRLRLGQRVMHKKLGYRGVICGWDEVCCENEEWQGNACVSDLQGGVVQPFYHVLVDMRDWPPPAAPVAYVADELLEAPEAPDTWLAVYGDDAFQHPYSYLLFLGADGAGDLVPCRQLRDKFSAKRRDVYFSSEEEHEGVEGDDDDVDKPPAPTAD